MFTYADPGACPACRSRLVDPYRCPACGFDLQSPKAVQLWEIFTRADELIASHPPPQPPPTQTPQPPTAQPTPPTPPQQQWQQPPAPERRKFSTGTILLSLGALFLLVAGAIFLTVTWGSLGIVARSLIMLAITALFGLGAWWATQKPLRASAESLWAVFLGLVTLDLFTARAEDLLGLGAIAFAWVALAWCAAFVAIAVTTADWLRLPSISAGITILVAAPAVAVELGENAWNSLAPFWSITIGTLVAVAATAVLWLRSRPWGAWIGTAVSALAVFAWVVAAVAEVYAGDQLVTLLDALPSIVVVLALVAVGQFVPVLRIPASALATLTLVHVLVAAIHFAWTDAGGPEFALVIPLAIFVAGLSFLAVGASRWWAGIRLAILPMLGLLGILAFASVLGDWWTPAVGWTGVALAVAAAHRWPEIPEGARPHVLPFAAVVAAFGTWFSVGATYGEFGLDALMLIVMGVALALGWYLRSHGWWSLAPPVIALLALGYGDGPPAWLLGVGALVLAGLAVMPAVEFRWIGGISAGLAVLVANVAVSQYLSDHTELSDVLIACVSASLAAAVLLVAMAMDEWTEWRVGAEIGAGLVAFAAIVATFDSLGHTAYAMSVVGLACVVVALLDSDRAILRYPGAALLALAYFVRLIASDVDIVEAYTAPFALVGLGAGWWAMRERESLRSFVALGPGLALAFLPSMPMALADPVSWRALLWGAAALVALGVGIWHQLMAPVVVGAVVLLLLVVAELWPLAAGLPRWSIIAIVGAVFMGIGLTWEKWVEEGRTRIQQLSQLR